MAATTTPFTLTTTWALVADGKANVSIERKSTALIDVYIGTTAPAADLASILVGTISNPPYMSIASLITGDKVYLRAQSGTAVAVVITAG